MKGYLETVRIGRYGGLASREVGPLGPGLNVVYGKNEAGKSTVVSLVRGVLFGWEEAHGVRNRYLPEEGGRAGELVWNVAPAEAARAPRAGGSISGFQAEWPGRPEAGGVFDGAAVGIAKRTSLVRDEGGATGATELLGDIDEETYDALFSLTADELRSLRGSPDVTARLLSAGSGTAADPAAAFVEVERSIANSPVYALSSELEEKRAQLRVAVERERLYVQEDRELRELKVSREATAARVAAVESELDDLREKRAELEAANARIELLEQEAAHVRDELEVLTASAKEEGSIDPRLLALDSSGDRVLCDRLDELMEERDKLNRALDSAKQNSSASTAAYEALCELDEEEVEASNRLRNRPGQAAVAVLLPVAFIMWGIPLFLHGRQINSLSITALGVSLVLVAVVLAVGAFGVLFRRPKAVEQLESRRKDAQWVMLQDRKKLDACATDLDELNRRAEKLLDDTGLSQAEGSLRQARLLLDEARSLRASKAEEAQRVSALELRIRMAEKEISEASAQRREIALATGLAENKSLTASLDALIRDKERQRDGLRDAASDMSERFGELSRGLGIARSDRTTDQLKLEYHRVRTRLREAKRDLVTLLLARRLLERSIATWEEAGQPEVYERAGELLATITGGRWVGVSTSRTGSLVAVDSTGTARDPRHLSLGTCQQLYLALRLAVLIALEDVGRSIPVLCDDILVNFDAERRSGAARALADLAEHRQVVIFTCHRETVAALKAAVAHVTCIDL